MKISFFEEFPTKKNLDKLKLVKFPTKLYVAAKSLVEFKKIKVPKRVKLVYWPVLDKKEGYWISPFAKTKALKEIFNQLKNEKIPVMLDLELTQKKRLYLTQIFNFRRNKRLIRNFIENYKGEIYTAEYPLHHGLKKTILESLGVHYDIKKINVIKMMYHSLMPISNRRFYQMLKKGKERYSNKYMAGFGTLAKGLGWEPILSPQQLEKDLEMAKKLKIKEVIIFRLGGLNKKYMRVIKK